MAGASQKKIAASNLRILKEIHTISLTILCLTLVAVFGFKRPENFKPFIFMNVPLIGCHFVLETSGRPKYQNNKLVGSVSDLKQTGLTEYMFDLIYFTLFENILMVGLGSNKVWWLYSIIPGFAFYKSFWLLKMGKDFLGIGRKSRPSPVETEAEQVKSKRQTKMEARTQKKIKT